MRRKTNSSRLLACFLAIAIVICGVLPGTARILAADTTTYTTNVTYGQTQFRTMLSLINDFRTGGNAWVWDASDTEKESVTGLEALTYDYGLERVAMQRAAELVFLYSHTRPNGESCFTAYENRGAAGENIAIGTGSYSVQEVYEMWLEENEPYSGQGHRRNMLGSSFRYVGLASVEYNGCHFWVQEFNSEPTDLTATAGNDQLTPVSVEVSNSLTTLDGRLSSAAPIEVEAGKTAVLPAAEGTLRLQGQWAYAPSVTTGSLDTTWESSDETIAVIDGLSVRGVAAGTVQLKATFGSSSETITCTVIGNLGGDTDPGEENPEDSEGEESTETPEEQPVAPPVYTTGDTAYSSDGTAVSVLKVEKDGQGYRYEVTYFSPVSTALGSVLIPETIDLYKDGKVVATAAVTGIGDSAFYGRTDLTAVVIEDGVSTIGAKAFYGCKNLKNVTLQVTSKTTIGSKAFSGIQKNARIQIETDTRKHFNMVKKLIKKTGKAPQKVKYKFRMASDVMW